jgi:hypothetical protein
MTHTKQYSVTPHIRQRNDMTKPAKLDGIQNKSLPCGHRELIQGAKCGESGQWSEITNM